MSMIFFSQLVYMCVSSNSVEMWEFVFDKKDPGIFENFANSKPNISDYFPKKPADISKYEEKMQESANGISCLEWMYKKGIIPTKNLDKDWDPRVRELGQKIRSQLGENATG